MSRMCYPSHHYPGPCSFNIKKRGLLFPPVFFLFPENDQPLSGILSISFYEFEPHLSRGQGRCTDINAEHVAKPFVLTHTLMNHMLTRVSISSEQWMGADRKILIPEHAPNVQGLKPLDVIGIHKKIILHVNPPSLVPYCALSRGEGWSRITLILRRHHS